MTVLFKCFLSVRNLIDFRSASQNKQSPDSVGGLREDQCGEWFRGAGGMAACGCKQKLKQNEASQESDNEYDEDYSGNDILNLRTTILDLRRS